MSISLTQVFVWVVVGALVGSFTGMLVKRDRAGFGPMRNLAVGLIGALIGGALFRVFRIDFGGNVAISVRDLVAAFVGSLLFLIGLAIWGRMRKA